MNWIVDLGAWTLEQIRHVGRLAIFSVQLFRVLPAALSRFCRRLREAAEIPANRRRFPNAGARPRVKA